MAIGLAIVSGIIVVAAPPRADEPRRQPATISLPLKAEGARPERATYRLKPVDTDAYRDPGPDLRLHMNEHTSVTFDGTGFTLFRRF